MGWRVLSPKSLLSFVSPRPNPSPFLNLRALSRSISASHPSDLRSEAHLRSPAAVKSELSDLSRKIGAVAAGNGADMETELDGLRLELSRSHIIEVIRILGDRNQSAFRFFIWASNSPRGCSMDHEVYDAVVNNLFSVQHYEAAACVLKKLDSFGYSPTEEAFRFLRRGSSSSSRDSVVGALATLKRVGGSCSPSGIVALIRVLCDVRSFDLAIFAMEQISTRASYFNALMAAKLRSGNFRAARELLHEMRRSNCAPNTVTYNHLLGSLFKSGRVSEGCGLLQVMEESGCLPDEVTYEVVIFRACRIGSMDVALGFLNKMLGEGLKPRLTTHAAVIKGFFRVGKVMEARKYVVEMCARDGCSANANYSLLANLLRMSGAVIEAADVLHELMEKGLKPNFPVYMRTVKDLQKIGRKDLASDLKCKFSMFPSPSR